MQPCVGKLALRGVEDDAHDCDARCENEPALHVDAGKATRREITACVPTHERGRRNQRRAERSFAELACCIAQMCRQLRIARDAFTIRTLDLVGNENRPAWNARSQTAAESYADHGIVERPTSTNPRPHDAHVVIAELALRGAVFGLRCADDDHFK